MYLSFDLVLYHTVQIQKINSILMCSYEATNSASISYYIETQDFNQQIYLIFMAAIRQITNNIPLFI